MSISVNIEDNFLPHDQFTNLQTTILSRNGTFPWTLSNIVHSNEDSLVDPKFNYQFIHQLFDFEDDCKSSFLHLISPVIDKIKPSLFICAKINLRPSTESVVMSDYHRDFADEETISRSTTSVFYINSNNGYTAFDTGKEDRVLSVANRLVTFPSSAWHAGASCTDAPYRAVLNLNYVK